MENLIFSLNATIPIFLMMLLGMLFRKLGWMDEVFAAKMNKFVFLVPLPVLLFEHDWRPWIFRKYGIMSLFFFVLW
ncbi:MAG: hypothetical protein ACLVAO_10315 [Clostridium fessum]